MTYQKALMMVAISCPWIFGCGEGSTTRTSICLEDKIFTYNGDIFSDMQQAQSDDELKQISSRLMFLESCEFGCTQNHLTCTQRFECHLYDRCAGGVVYTQQACSDGSIQEEKKSYDCPSRRCINETACLDCICSCDEAFCGCLGKDC
jgi:hypothetical protein